MSVGILKLLKLLNWFKSGLNDVKVHNIDIMCTIGSIIKTTQLSNNHTE